MMQTDVSSAYITSSGAAAYTGRIRLKGIYLNASGAATVVLSDASGGPTLFKIDSPASATNNPIFIPIPGEGILFQTSIYVTTLTGVNSITVFYG